MKAGAGLVEAERITHVRPIAPRIADGDAVGVPVGDRLCPPMSLRDEAPRPGHVPTVRDFARLNLIGDSPAFRDALKRVARIAGCEAPTLIEGETGTGKELAARAIHYLGARHDFPFVPVNCGAIPEHLVENELFGHARGAYTDARDGHDGVVAEAEGGTLFLDEVETLSQRAQVALLRFLQDGTFRRLGSRGVEHANVRIIAASNATLSRRVDEGTFRSDLLYRLTVMSLHMPPLRARGLDVQRLADHFLKRLSQQYGGAERRLDAASIDYLLRYAWPGNVRELENVLHREFLLAETALIHLGDHRPPPPTDARSSSTPTFRAARAIAIAEFERSYVMRALAQAGGNVSLAARLAGKERRSFGKLMKKYGVERSRYLAS
jgi:DNA-binding NtrC family response regulator